MLLFSTCLDIGTQIYEAPFRLSMSQRSIFNFWEPKQTSVNCSRPQIPDSPKTPLNDFINDISGFPHSTSTVATDLISFNHV